MKDKTKKPRVDKRKNVGKVAEVLSKDPNTTIRDISDQTGLSVGAVYSSKREVEQSGTKDDTIAYIVGSAKDRLKRVSKIFDQIIIDSENILFNEDGTRKTIESKNYYGETIKTESQLPIKEKLLIKDIAKDDMARITVLGGKITDDNGGLKEILDEDKLKAIQSLANSFLIK